MSTPAGVQYLYKIGGVTDFARREEAIVFYNLTCYSCQLGDFETAKSYLKQAIKIDSSWRIAALDDKDLEPLWKTLGANS